MNYKTDLELGEKVKNHLTDLQIETPTIPNRNKRSTDEKLEIIQHQFFNIMQVLGLDLNNDSLKETPARVAKMFVNEIFEGLDYNNFPKCTTVNNGIKYDEMLIEKGITVNSVCEHHFQNIVGTCKIAYIPNEKVLGLSKLNRIVRFFSKRPQIQERLTVQIQAALCLILDTENVAVEITAEHHCVKTRGIEDANSLTTSRKLGGCFKVEHETRAEFLNS